jgi:hypothetical protein
MFRALAPVWVRVFVFIRLLLLPLRSGADKRF